MAHPSGWRRMLTLFTLASFIEVIAYGQLAAFTPLHLPKIGVAPEDVPAAVGLIAVGANVFGVLFLPFWGVLADRYGLTRVLGIDALLLPGVVLGRSFGYRDSSTPAPERPPILRAALEGLALIWRSPRLRALFPALLILFAGWLLTFTYLPLV